MHADSSGDRPILLLANGNLNGRVIRLVADALHKRRGQPTRVVTLANRLGPLTSWPDERIAPHSLPLDQIDLHDAERCIRDAAVFVLPPFWEEAAQRLIGIARQVGTPVVCLVADLGYGEGKLNAAAADGLPDRICVSDPVTRAMLLRNGIPESLLHNVGSPYFDSVLASAALPQAPAVPLRIGILANPDGVRKSRAALPSPEGVIDAVNTVLGQHPGATMTVRLHPRQNPATIAETFPLPESARFDPLTPRSTLWEFLAAHHLVVGSYTLALMVARMLGRPAVSYQPRHDEDLGLRHEIFAAWDIPVVTDEQGLGVAIAEQLRAPGPPLVPSDLLYEPGRALEAISNIIFATQPISPLACRTTTGLHGISASTI